MTRPRILCVAITGSVARKSDNPAVPITVPEQIASTHAAHEASAAIAHRHARQPPPTADPERFARLREGIGAHCPGMIVQLSTGGRSGAGRARPDLARGRRRRAITPAPALALPLHLGSNTHFPSMPPARRSPFVNESRMRKNAH